MLTEGMNAEILSKSNESAQRTLAIIKPEAAAYAEEIEDKIREDGYTIVQVQKPQYSSSYDCNVLYELHVIIKKN
jgi:nucleoside diphosphate kinase